MLPNRDVWQAANLLIEQHGTDAEIVAVKRADELLDRNDIGEYLVWLRIVKTLRELRAPPTGLPN
jgi:hypothetical protein